MHSPRSNLTLLLSCLGLCCYALCTDPDLPFHRPRLSCLPLPWARWHAKYLPRLSPHLVASSPRPQEPLPSSCPHASDSPIVWLFAPPASSSWIAPKGSWHRSPPPDRSETSPRIIRGHGRSFASPGWCIPRLDPDRCFMFRGAWASIVLDSNGRTATSRRWASEWDLPGHWRDLPSAFYSEYLTSLRSYMMAAVSL